MNLIDVYLSEVGRNLPAKSRSDIEAEIRSTLQDMLEERSKSSGRPVDDELTLAVLKEFGSPQKVAASYGPERYLIGPRLYPTFERVLFAVLPITIVLGLVGLGFAPEFSGTTARDVIGLISNTFGTIFTSAITTAGWLVFIFVIIERTVPEMKIKEKEWDPRNLVKLSPPDRARYGDAIAEIVTCFVAIMIFNFSPQIFRFTPSLNSVAQSGDWNGVTFLPLLSEAFFRWLPALNVLWGLTIIFHMLLLSQGRWQTWTRWSFLGLKVFSVGVAIAMLAGPSLVGLTAASLMAAGTFTLETAGLLVTMMNQIVRWSLVFAILFGAWEIIRALVRLARGAVRISAPIKG